MDGSCAGSAPELVFSSSMRGRKIERVIIFMQLIRVDCCGDGKPRERKRGGSNDFFNETDSKCRNVL